MCTFVYSNVDRSPVNKTLLLLLYQVVLYNYKHVSLNWTNSCKYIPSSAFKTCKYLKENVNYKSPFFFFKKKEEEEKEEYPLLFY